MDMRSPAVTVFLRRLCIGWILSWMIVALVGDGEGIDLIFRDAMVAFFVIGTGPLVAVLSSWHHFSPIKNRRIAVFLTAICTVAASMLVFTVDVGRREEMDGLITVLAIFPQLLMLDVCVIIFAVRDRNITHS